MLSRFRQFVLCLFMLVPAWATAQTVGTVRFDFDVDTLDAKAQAQAVDRPAPHVAHHTLVESGR